MRKYTEPVALFKDVLPGGQFRKSWKPVGDPEHMDVGYWVDCEGFRELRIEAVGSDDYTIVVYSFPEEIPAPPAPDPLLQDHITLKGLPTNVFTYKVVTQTIDVNGAKAVGLSLQSFPTNGNPTISLRAFLR